MTTQEAIEFFKGELEGGKCSEHCVQCNANEFALQALEKQIPKKPILDTIFPSGVKWFRCPICNKKIVSKLGEWISGRPQKYCDNCGQKLDWSESNER